MTIKRTVLVEETNCTEYVYGESRKAPEQIAPPSRITLKGESELTKTDKNRQRRHKKQRQSKYFAQQEQKLREVAIVRGDKKAQVKLDKIAAERRLKSLKNVKVLTKTKPGTGKKRNDLKKRS